jgi:hypothetical protein
MQNRAMESYEEYLTKGEWLDAEERLELYHFLKHKHENDFSDLEKELRLNGISYVNIAKSQIKFVLDKNIVKNQVRELGQPEFVDGMRFVKLSNMRIVNRKRLPRFIAQCEVDAIWNFPLDGKFTKTADGFGINSYPYYDLNYYSNGRGRVRGFFAKFKYI